MENNQDENNEKEIKNEKHNDNNFIKEGVEFVENGKKIQVLQQENAEILKYNLAFKVIVIGNSYVGKSSLVNSALKNRFLDNYSSTIGFDYCSFYVRINDDVIKLQIWDTCGQEIYQSLISNFYRYATSKYHPYISHRNLYGAALYRNGQFYLVRVTQEIEKFDFLILRFFRDIRNTFSLV